MVIKKGQLIELDVEGLAFGGKGLARVDGLAVFIEQALPGDRILAKITKKKKNYAEARSIEVIKASEYRISPPCKYSGICGGCSWQFLNYEQQLFYKQQHVRESLEHIALIKGISVLQTLTTQKIFGYRNKMEFSCATRRWLTPDELGREDIVPDIALGLHVPGTFNKIIDIDMCLLQAPDGNEILSDVRRYIKSSSMPVYELRSHEGYWRFLVLRHSERYDQWMVNMVTSTLVHEQIQPLADFLVKKYPNIVSVINNISAKKAAVAIGDHEVLLAGRENITEGIGPFEFDISANSFFQTNSKGAELLYETVKGYAGLTGREIVVDLYCGAGTISIFLAMDAQQIIGLESNPGAVADANRNCIKNGIDNCRFISGDVRFTLSQLDIIPDVMIIDPPRVGMHEDVVHQVIKLGPPRIVYVSCNPATLARDLLLLKNSYRLVEVQPVDMFPHTYHIEAVALLEKN